MRGKATTAVWRWRVLWAVYLLLAGQLNPAELILGLAAALISTVAVGIAHRHSAMHFIALGEPSPRTKGDPAWALILRQAGLAMFLTPKSSQSHQG